MEIKNFMKRTSIVIIIFFILEGCTKGNKNKTVEKAGNPIIEG